MPASALDEPTPALRELIGRARLWDMVPTTGVYLGVAALVVGLAAVMHPLPWLALPNRVHGGAATLAGLVLALTAASWPARERRVTQARSGLDTFAPSYQFSELHRIRVHAPLEAAYRAAREVRADEIRFFRTLIAIRYFPRKPRIVRQAPSKLPILEVATRSGVFLWLTDVPGEELVVGTVVRAPRGTPLPHFSSPAEFVKLNAPGYTKAVMSFHFEPEGDGATLVTTETRVFSTDAAARRRFARYWRVIMPGSALIRRGWLRAIRQRAESGEFSK